MQQPDTAGGIMLKKIAINGLGRIGRLVLAAMAEEGLIGKAFEVAWVWP